MARFGQGPSKEPYLEQIHSNFVSFILHLNDQDNNVKKSCKYVLKQVGPLIRSNNINELFQTHLIEDKSLHYGEFINDLSKLLVCIIFATLLFIVNQIQFNLIMSR